MTIFALSLALDKTFELLAASQHAAVDRILLDALESPHAPLQAGALRTLLTRRSAAGDRWILTHWGELDEQRRAMVVENAGSMTSAIREAIVGSDLERCRHACDLAVRLGDHDLIPALVNAVESANAEQARLCGETVLALTADLGRLTRDREADRPNPLDLEPVRRNVLASLERFVKRFQRHKPVEPLEALLLLVDVQDETLRTILQDSHDPAFVSLVHLLAHSPRAGVLRFLLDSLCDPQATSAALHAIGHRDDLAFMRQLLERMGDRPSEAVRANLRRIETFVWLRDGIRWLNDLNEWEQDRLVAMLLETGIKKADLFRALESVMRDGKTLGRRAAAKALSDFHGMEASVLTMQALDDDDPQVQAAAVSQLRQRGLSNTLTLLLNRLESPHHVVRQAARASLAEYSFKRYLASFDILNEAARRSTGKLVKRIDPQTVPLLLEQFRAESRTKRLRALSMAVVLELWKEFEAEAIEILADPDHVVRAEACRLLGYCDSVAAKTALQRILNDASVVVREAAAASLTRLAAGTAQAAKGVPATPNNLVEPSHA